MHINKVAFLIIIWMQSMIGSQDIEVRAMCNARMEVAVCVSPIAPEDIKEVASTLKSDLEFSEQCGVKIIAVADFDREDLMTALCSKGYELAICVRAVGTKKEIEWFLCDTVSGVVAARGIYKKQGSVARGWGHAIADLVWPLITGEPGFFSSQIAYCKEVRLASGKMAQHVCIADYDGSHEQVVVATPTVNVGPRFNRDARHQVLYYSQYTPKNIRLMSASSDRKKKIVSNFDGVNMLPSFSRDGSCVAYCASKGLGTCDIYYVQKGGALEKITFNGGNNFSPVLSDDGNRIFYCSDVKNGVQQIYCYHKTTHTHMPVTALPGDAWSPTYCEQRHKLAYCKKAKDTVQLFVHDEVTKTDTQLTHTSGHKDMCVWSPCGNYLLYCKSEKGCTRLACFNVLTGTERYITPDSMKCSFPAWSGVYDVYPVIA